MKAIIPHQMSNRLLDHDLLRAIFDATKDAIEADDYKTLEMFVYNGARNDTKPVKCHALNIETGKERSAYYYEGNVYFLPREFGHHVVCRCASEYELKFV